MRYIQFATIVSVIMGEGVIITKEYGSGFKIIPLPNKRPYPRFGSAAGLVEMSDDFDEPLDDFKEYMP